MIRSKEEVSKGFEFTFSYISQGRGFITEEDFIDLVKHMYWVKPKEGQTNFLNVNIQSLKNRVSKIYGVSKKSKLEIPENKKRSRTI